jgi:hypothetical protein
MFLQVVAGDPARTLAVLHPAPGGRLAVGVNGLSITARDLLQELLASEPDAWMVGALAALEADGVQLSADDRLTMVQCWDRVAAWVSSRQLAAVAVACPEPISLGDAHPAACPDDDWSREELAAATNQSPAAADRRITLARRLLAALPATAAALHAGRIGYLHALTISELTEHLTTEQCQAVEGRVIEDADAQTVSAFRFAVRRAILAVVPEDSERRRREAVARRRVRMWDEPDGMATIAATLPADQAIAAWKGLAAEAARLRDHDRRSSGDHPTGIRVRGVDAARADAFAATLAGLLDSSPAKRKGRRPSVNVTVDWATLAGLADHPGDLQGYGPIPASYARWIAQEATWRRLVVDPVTRSLLDYGRTAYAPPQPLVDFIQARDRTCRFPGCRRAAYWCDDEHAVPAPEGGTTDPASLYALCRRHHRLKTRGVWAIKLEPDGTAVWTSRTGRRYVVPPPRRDE